METLKTRQKWTHSAVEMIHNLRVSHFMLNEVAVNLSIDRKGFVAVIDKASDMVSEAANDLETALLEYQPEGFPAEEEVVLGIEFETTKDGFEIATRTLNEVVKILLQYRLPERLRKPVQAYATFFNLMADTVSSLGLNSSNQDMEYVNTLDGILKSAYT